MRALGAGRALEGGSRKGAGRRPPCGLAAQRGPAARASARQAKVPGYLGLPGFAQSTAVLAFGDELLEEPTLPLFGRRWRTLGGRES